MRIRWIGPLLSVGALVLVTVTPLRAQSGAVTGRVTDAETGAPLAGARIEIVAGGGVVGVGAGNEQGRFLIADIAAGTYTVVASLIGYATQRVEGVEVGAGQTALVTGLALRPQAVQLNPVVVSASKRQERALDAPAHVEVVDGREVLERPTPNLTANLRSVPGIDIVAQGMGTMNVVARGFNNIFSGALMVLTDHRISGVPSLRVNSLSLLPTQTEDVERMEVVLGPGSALYGPNTANGVLHVLTKSPLDHQGTIASVMGGEREVASGSVRTSHLLTEDLGIKVSARYFQGREWEHTDPVELQTRQAVLPADPDTRIGLRDFDLMNWSVDARADWRISPELTAIVSGGQTKTDGIDLNGIGASQLMGWTYRYYQARANWRRAFAQVYMTESDAGETYNLRTGADYHDNSSLLVAQLQHGFSLGERQDFIYGLDYIGTRPDTRGTIHGDNEDRDDLTEFGGYLQSETSLGSRFDLVLAGRLDKHSEIEDPIFSPRAGIVFKPRENHNLRLTYNRAYATPGALNYFLDLNSGAFPDATLAGLGYGLRLEGNRGFTFRRSSGYYGMRSPFTANPSQVRDVRPVELYLIALGILRAQGAIDDATYTYLSSLNPADDAIGINVLNARDRSVAPLSEGTAPDIAPLVQSTNQTFEVGYKGILGDRVLVAADVWHSRIDNFITPLGTIGLHAKFLMLNGPELAAFLVANGVPAAQASALAAGVAPIPLGIIASEDANSEAGRADALITYSNFGEVELWGADLSATALLNDRWSLGVVASVVSDDFFETEGQHVWLNAPSTKGSATLGYRNVDAGFNGDVRVRYTDGFPAESGVHSAIACVNPNAPGTTACIEPFTLLDLTLGYRLPDLSGASVHLSVNNVLDEAYRSYAGVPDVGRQALLRLVWEF